MFSARYWLFMVPLLAGILAANVRVSTFGLPLGTVVMIAVVLVGRIVFDILLYRYWTRNER